MNRKAVVPMKPLAGAAVPILVAASLINSTLGSPFVPMKWQSLVESGPHQGMRKHIGWIHDMNGDFIDDAFDTLGPGEEAQVIVQLNECFGSFEDYEAYFRPYGDLIHKGVLVAYVILDRVPQERLQDLADDPRVAALEYPSIGHMHLDTSTRSVQARASNTYGTNTFPNIQGAGTGSGVTIAIVDTGVDDGHGAFGGSFSGGYNAVTNILGNPDDDSVYIDTGSNGICQTTAALTDFQRILPNQGEPDMACIGAGANGVLNSMVMGDDGIGTVNGVPAIGTGANGVCESILGGDDNQWIPRWQGAPWSPCVLPATNGRIDTARGGDDDLNDVFHGTHVAGIALGRGAAGAGNTRNANDGSTPNNGTGMAPGANLLDVKAIDAAGRVELSVALRALDWVFKDGRADVVNMSFGWSISSDGTSVLSKVVDALAARGVAVAVSVGNLGAHTISYPADSEFATTVAWADDHGTVNNSDDTIDPDSSFGPRMDYDKNKLTVGMLKPDIAAPGGAATAGSGILSALGNNATNDYQTIWGSSMASPHVAGAMALLIALGHNTNRDIPPGALKDLLKRTATRSMPTHSAMDATVDADYDEHWGYGLLNVHEAAKQLKKGVADISFPAATGPHPQYPTVRRCLIKGGKASYENDFDIRLADDPPVVNQLNTISVDIENRSTATAHNVVVSVGVIDFGVGGQVYDGNSITVKSLPGPGKTTVAFKWRPRSANHQCIQATIDYGLDTDFTNNLTQRNIKQVKTSSPARSSFVVRNPLHERATIILEPRLDPATQRNFSIEMSATEFDMEPEDCPELVDIQFFPNGELPPGTAGRVDINATAFSGSEPDGVELTGVVFNVITPSPEPLANLVRAINCGGETAGHFDADTSFADGSTWTSDAPIDTSGLSESAPQAVYQTERYGDFVYEIARLQAGQEFVVRLHFAEIFFHGANQRVFDVFINDSLVLDDYDIFEQAGTRNRAVAEDFNVRATSDGIRIRLVGVVDNAKCSGIEVFQSDDQPPGEIVPTVWWPFDEVSGTITHDSVGPNHGTVHGASWTRGKVGGALSFDGLDDVVITPVNIDQSSRSAGLTLCAWVFPESIESGRHQVISTDDGGYDWSLLCESESWYVFTGNQSANTELTVDPGQWQFVAAVFEPESGVSFYKNGQDISIPSIDYDVSDNNIAVGDNPGPWGEFFAGKIDEVRVYDRALSAEQIARVFSGTINN
ncbi:MAG: S8 family serine peptidase [Planctomycetota bacterium]